MAKKEIKKAKVLITRGILIAGESVAPGEKVELPVHDARRLVHSKKATFNLEHKIQKPQAEKGSEKVSK